jgi:YggT family protein
VDLICVVLALAYWGVIIWVVLSWVVGYGRVPWDHPVHRVYDAINRALQPVLLPLRRVLPPVQLGAVAFDLSPLVLIFGLLILQRILC